jgi:hypothetical protein
MVNVGSVPVTGSVSVTVVPEVKNFTRDLKAKFKAMDLKVDVGAEVTGLDETLAKAKEKAKAAPIEAPVKARDVGLDATLARMKAVARKAGIGVSVGASVNEAAVASAEGKIKELARKAGIEVKIKSKADLAQEKAQIELMKREASRSELKVPLRADKAGFSRDVANFLGRGRWWGGPLVAALPAAGTLLGAGVGAGAGLGGAAIAGGGALAAYGAVAGPVLTDAKKAQQTVEKAKVAYGAQVTKIKGQYAFAVANPPPGPAPGAAQAGSLARAQITYQAQKKNIEATYKAAIAGATTHKQKVAALAAEQLNLTKALNNYNAAVQKGGTAQGAVSFKAKAYAAEQKKLNNAQLSEQQKITAAYGGMSDAQIKLSKQLGDLATQWDAFKAAETPVIAASLQPWFKSLTDGMTLLKPIIDKVSPVIGDLGKQFDNLVKSRDMKVFDHFIAVVGSRAVGAFGKDIIDFIHGFIILLPQFNPLIQDAITWVGKLGPSFLKWSQSKKASDDIKKFMQWFKDNGPAAGNFIKALGGAIATLVPGLTAGGKAELILLTGFLNFVKGLPPGIAAPLAEVAGAALILAKLPGGKKVITYAVSLVGKGISALLSTVTGGKISLGGESAAVSIKAAMVQGGEAAAISIREAMATGGTTAGGEIAASERAGGVGAGAAAGKGITAGIGAIGWVGIGLAIGAGIEAAGTALGNKTALSRGTSQALANTPQVLPPSPGVTGFEGWAASKAATYTASIPNSATLTAQAKALFDLLPKGSKALLNYNDAVQKYGVNSGQAATAAQVLVSQVASSGKTTLPQAAKAVSTYGTNWVLANTSAKGHVAAVNAAADAVRKAAAVSSSAAGITRSNTAAVHGFTKGLEAVGVKAPIAARDTNAFADAIKNHGRNSDAYRRARATLIADLQKTGVDAGTARTTVDKLGSSIKVLPAHKHVNTTTNADAAKKKIQDLGSSVVHLPSGKTITVTVALKAAVGKALATTGANVSSALSGFFGSFFGGPPPKHRAAGGLARGWAVVGEQGPELAYFGGRGAMIVPAAPTRQALSAMRGGGYAAGAGYDGASLMGDTRAIEELLAAQLAQGERQPDRAGRAFADSLNNQGRLSAHRSRYNPRGSL